MLIYLTLLILVVLGVLVSLTAYFRRNAHSILKSTHRAPRDISTIALIERFGQKVQEQQKTNLAAPHHSTVRSNLKDEIQTTTSRVNISHQDSLITIEGVVQALWFSTTPIHNLMSIDEHVYTAMSSLAGQQIDSISDLSKHLSSWESAEIGESLPEGALNKLMGHLSEPIVAQHMEDLGINVKMPDVSNQDGYDLIMNDNYFVNVKTVADASSLSDHFQEYPEIPVIIPSDIAGFSGEAINLSVSNSIDTLEHAIRTGEQRIVLTDDFLSHSDMLSHTERVSDALLGNVDAFGIPVITVLCSGSREILLLWNKKTDWKNAVKNAGSDIIGTGGGLAAGGSLGALMGTFILPGIGTVVGTFFGGATGSVLLRKFTSKFKKRRLRKAIRKYEPKATEAQQSFQKFRSNAQKKTESFIKGQTSDLQKAAKVIKNELDTELTKVISEIKGVYTISSKQARELLDLAINDLKQLHDRLLKWRWQQIFWGKSLWILWKKRVDDLQKICQYLALEQSNLAKSEPQLSIEYTINLLQLILCLGTQTDTIRELISSFEIHRKEREKQWELLITQNREDLIQQRFQCMNAIAERIRDIQGNIDCKVEKINQDLQPYSDKVIEELEKLGLNVTQSSE